MVFVGIVLTLATITVLALEVARHRKNSMPKSAWVALIALVAAGVLMLRGVYWVAVYFTPIAWTCYLVMADGAVRAITGRSRLQDRREFAWMTLLSIPLWLIFEAYNLRLQNWVYVGVPKELPLALLGYGWSFATITPAIFETADLVEAFGWFGPRRPMRFSSAAERGMTFFGALCLIIPLALPQQIAAYWFALVWVGFVFLLDPINRRLGLPSLLGDLAEGRRSRLWSLFLAGWVCGWLWEFWNYWSSAKWHYIFPIFQQWKVFEMPIPGYLGFLPFALECFVMYVTARWIVSKLVSHEGHEGITKEAAS